MKEPLRLLLVEDSEDDAFFLLTGLRHRGGYEVVSKRVETPEAFVAALDGASWDVVVSDYYVPGFGALWALALLKEKGLNLPFIVVSGKLGEETAVEVMRAGARDYVMKHNLARLGPIIERELGEAETRRRRTKQLEVVIEELRFNEQVLRESEERFRATFEQAAVGMAHVGIDGRWLKVNQKLCDIVGYACEELLETTFQDITHPDDLGKDLEQVRRILDGEIETYSIEKRYIKKDGSISWAELTVSLVREPSGEPEYFISVVEDITERKQMEDDLRHNLGALLALYEAGQILASSLDLEEIATRFLKVMQRLSSLTTAIISLPDERQELRVWRAVGLNNLWARARYAPEVQATLREVLETGNHRSFRLKGSKEDNGSLVGMCLPLQIQNRSMGLLEVYGPEELLEENAAKLLGSMTSQAASALENARLYGELAEREKQLEDLVGKLLRAQEEERRRVAYEVHDGLTQVATAAQQRLETFAQRHPQASEKGEKDLDRILELAQRTVGEARRVVSNLRPVALDDFGLVVALHQETAELRDEGLQVDYEEDLGKERLPEAVETVLFRIGQEALTNVRKHAQVQRARLEIRRRNNEVILEVQDWGCGFEPDALNVGNGPGERVGISGMRERVGMLGGEFEIRSRPGEGTRVTVRITLSALEEDERDER